MLVSICLFNTPLFETLFYPHYQGAQNIEAVSARYDAKRNCTVSKSCSNILILFVHGGWLSALLVSAVGGNLFRVLDVHIYSPLFSTPCLVIYMYSFAYHHSLMCIIPSTTIKVCVFFLCNVT
ncbi:hypothetical protein BO85DRAFT_73315 [Aspergillus piperis CBS 112811]|uniref:Uncharacterized protein n=1 Tax=Aspergillus piperis CBS 112811 TaxID=1448313 RepID=A0A8G1QXI0_9EURO|nr:hypothetical protein BO85DRAFT_73315 [Aspergillus piperis CBS 112811]RAH55524.1 hypothetical protein BO85DRAFT_73315 [Aspergillus piperis CBS 112811]